MNRVLTAATAAALGVAVQLAPALACETNAAAGSAAVPLPAAAGGAMLATATPHYEWQYHYVGRHGRIEGHWVLVN
jgi:hypothetical protein